MKLTDLFKKHTNDGEGGVRRNANPDAQQADPTQPSPANGEVNTFTGMPPGSDVRIVPEMLEKVTPSTKGVR